MSIALPENPGTPRHGDVFAIDAQGRRLRQIAAGICLLAALLIFVLPLFVPMRPIQTESASYNAGFNNTVAVLAAVGLSVAVLLGLWRSSLLRRASKALASGPGTADRQRLSRPFIATVIAASTAVLALCSWLVAASHLRYLGDAGYIIEQATVRQTTGRTLYTQLEFAYGPLLLFPEIWLSELLHGSITAAYYIVFVVESALGLGLVAFVLNELPIRGSLRRAGLILLAVGAVTPHLGLNYTYLRFAGSFAVLLWATRSGSVWRCAAFLAAGELLEVFISPEQGLALAVGISVFALWRAWDDGPQWLIAGAAPLGILAVTLLTLGRSYLRMAATFSRGALNLPVGPYPHLLVYLFALVWLVPVGVVSLLRADKAARPRLMGMYALNLAFVPAALGRCDPLHVLFDGLGVLLLSLAAVSRMPPRVRRGWVVALALLVFWNHWVNERLFDARNAQVLRETVMPHLPRPARNAIYRTVGLHRPDLAAVLGAQPEADLPLDMTALHRITGGAPIATPLDLTPVVERQLQQSGQYSPGYYAFWADMMNPVAEARSIRDVNGCPFLLLPAPLGFGNPHVVSWLRRFQGLSLPYRPRHAVPYDPGAAFTANLRQRWVSVEAFGPYMLYRQIRTGGAG